MASGRSVPEINGQLHYLWRAVDQDGDVLDILVQSHRDRKAAKKFFRKLLKGLRYVPSVIVTDKLRSYNAAKVEIMPVSNIQFVFVVHIWQPLIRVVLRQNLIGAVFTGFHHAARRHNGDGARQLQQSESPYLSPAAVLAAYQARLCRQISAFSYDGNTRRSLEIGSSKRTQ